jgi:hypothetical protein
MRCLRSFSLFFFSFPLLFPLHPQPLSHVPRKILPRFACVFGGCVLCAVEKIRGYICIKNKVGGGMEGQGRRGLRKEGVGAIPGLGL